MRPTSILAATAASLLLVQAVPAGAETVDLGAIPAGTYRLDPLHSNVLWKVSHLGFANFIGRFNDFDATLEYDRENPEASTLTVTIDPTSIDVNLPDFETKLSTDANLFNTGAHPEITFRSTEIDQGEGVTGTVTGDMTLLGNTAPLTFQVRLNGAKPNPFNQAFTLGFSATGVVERANWGMDYLVPNIGNAVEVEIEAEFKHQGN